MKVIIPLLTLFATGCSITCIHPTSAVEERTVEIGSFTGIDVGGAAQVTVEKGDVQQVKVTAQPEVIALLETKVSGGVWEIGTSKCWTSDKGLAIHITTPAALTSVEVSGSADVELGNVFSTDITELSTSGSGSISAAEINAKALKVDISGSGTITVRGTCTSMDADISGSGNLHAVDMAANAVDVEIAGSGKADVKAISTLNASVSGSGEVHYSGKPDLKSSISGSGSVMPLP